MMRLPPAPAVDFFDDFWRALGISLFRECDSDFDFAETRWRCAVACAHRLHRLAFAAIRSAPERPVIASTNCVATIPEFSGDPAVAGILDHAAFFAAFDLPTDFG